MMDISVNACAGCHRTLEPEDQVVMVVPFAERGPVVRMGDELLFHEACEPHHAGLRVVGRGNQREVVEGVQRAYHPDSVDAGPV
jgi:hypothetical protein